jgi:L-asparaginase II
VIGPPLSIHFSGNLQFKKSVSSLWKFGGSLSCWNSVPSGHSLKIDMRNSSKLSRSLHQSRCNSGIHLGFLYLKCQFNDCECSTYGGKIWKLEWHEL